jgi:hypothetical protein
MGTWASGAGDLRRLAVGTGDRRRPTTLALTTGEKADLSIGVTTPLGLNAEEIGSLMRQALIQMANDFGFTAADTAQI